MEYDHGSILLVSGHEFVLRGEVLESLQCEQLRKRLSSIFSLVKNESQEFKPDQIPSRV